MAQLRDAQTGECISEGTPLEMALLARSLARETMFDDVGEGFDPEVVIAAHEENLRGLQGALKEASGEERDSIQSAIEQGQAAQQILETMPEVNAAIDEAQAKAE